MTTGVKRPFMDHTKVAHPWSPTRPHKTGVNAQMIKWKAFNISGEFINFGGQRVQTGKQSSKLPQNGRGHFKILAGK